MTLSWLQVLARLGAAVGVGILLGAEREFRGHEAGLKTHVLVCLGACLFTVEGAFGFPIAEAGHSSALRADITRVTSQIVVGIGFLGGGVIMRQGASVKGLTTAAGLWVSAALGVACGLGRYIDAGFGALLVLATYIGLKAVEDKLRAGQHPHGEE